MTAPNIGVELYDDSVAFADRARNRLAISEPGRFRTTISAPVDGIYYIRLYTIDDSSTTGIHVRLGFSRTAPPAPPPIATPPSSTIDVQAPTPRRTESAAREQERQYAAPLQRKLHGAIGRVRLIDLPEFLIGQGTNCAHEGAEDQILADGLLLRSEPIDSLLIMPLPIIRQALGH